MWISIFSSKVLSGGTRKSCSLLVLHWRNFIFTPPPQNYHLYFFKLHFKLPQQNPRLLPHTQVFCAKCLKCPWFWIDLNGFSRGSLCSHPQRSKTHGQRRSLWSTARDHDLHPKWRAFSTFYMKKKKKSCLQHKSRVLSDLMRQCTLTKVDKFKVQIEGFGCLGWNLKKRIVVRVQNEFLSFWYFVFLKLALKF